MLRKDKRNRNKDTIIFLKKIKKIISHIPHFLNGFPTVRNPGVGT